MTHHDTHTFLFDRDADDLQVVATDDRGDEHWLDMGGNRELRDLDGWTFRTIAECEVEAGRWRSVTVRTTRTSSTVTAER